MKLTARGIGWLIAGVLVCCSMTETDSIASAAGTLGIGITFIAVYLMKQKFDPSGIALFIVGGIFGAFTLEETLNFIYGFVSRLPVVKDDLSTILLGVFVTVGCFFAFYRINKGALEYGEYDYHDEGDDDGFSMPYQEGVFMEDIVEVSEVNPKDKASASEDDEIVEIEIVDGD